MKRYFFHLFASLAFFLVIPPSFAEPSTKIQASYDVIGFGMTLANIEETFTRTGDNKYQIDSVTKAVGLLASLKPETVNISSTGSITDQGLLPYSFSMTRKVDTQKNASAQFDWTKSLITQTDYKGVVELPLSAGTQDRLSVLYQLPYLAKTGRSEFKFDISDGNRLETYSFSLSPEERTVRVPLGSFKTRFISNTPVGDQVKYEVWMSTEGHYFPYKVIVTDAKGGKLTQVLTDLITSP